MALAATPALAETGDLVQKPGTLGCITNNGTDSKGVAGACADGESVRASTIVLSPDGKNAYVRASHAVSILDRDAATGTLTQKPGTAGCITRDGNGGACAVAPALENANSVTISPDGKNVYAVTGAGVGSIVTFDRDATTGALTQKPGTAGCLQEQGDGVICADIQVSGSTSGSYISMTISPDGNSAYVGAQGQLPEQPGHGAVGIFDRNPATGVLTQKPGAAGCMRRFGENGCAVLGVLRARPSEIRVSGDGKNVYMAVPEGGGGGGGDGGAIIVFDRVAATGVLTQKAGTAGCISYDGSGGTCAMAVAVDGAWAVTVSPDGKNVYVATRESQGVAIFDRDTTTGALTQKPGTAGCITSEGTGGACVTAAGFQRLAQSVEVSPDGKSVYVAVGFPTFDGAVVILDRDPVAGGLTPKAGTAGCISHSGSTPGGACRLGNVIAAADDIAISPDGKNVYVGALGISIFDRDLGDITAADTTIGFGPADGSATNDSTPAFEFSSDPASTFECRVDTAAFASCSSPHTTSVLGDGAHSFAVRATDAAGNVDASPASRSFSVDTAAPQTSVGAGPAGATGDRKPTFAFASSEAGSSFACRVDTDAFVSCSSPHTTAALGDGAHTFEVRATDPVGNVDASPASRSFSVDTAAPQTSIGAGPVGMTDDATPTFAFASSEAGSSFACRVDDGEFVSCGSPHTTAALGNGAHSFAVRATDAVGNVDQSAASRSFAVVPAVAAVAAVPAAPVGAGKTINGTPGKDRLVGTAGDDVINCGAGDDVVIAGGGDDTINCGAGKDTVSGGAGNDTINGGAGNDKLSGSAGNDRISGNAGDDRLLGGSGRDRLFGGAGKDVLLGGAGLDVLSGGPGKDKETQ